MFYYAVPLIFKGEYEFHISYDYACSRAYTLGTNKVIKFDLDKSSEKTEIKLYPYKRMYTFKDVCKFVGVDCDELSNRLYNWDCISHDNSDDLYKANMICRALNRGVDDEFDENGSKICYIPTLLYYHKDCKDEPENCTRRCMIADIVRGGKCGKYFVYSGAVTKSTLINGVEHHYENSFLNDDKHYSVVLPQFWCRTEDVAKHFGTYFGEYLVNAIHTDRNTHFVCGHIPETDSVMQLKKKKKPWYKRFYDWIKLEVFNS